MNSTIKYKSPHSILNEITPKLVNLEINVVLIFNREKKKFDNFDFDFSDKTKIPFTH